MDSINEARRSTAQYFLEGLTEIGCDYLFCNFGTDHAPIIEAMAAFKRDGRKAPKTVICPHEITAAHMAAGYFLATGRGQGVMVHVDSGTANSAMALHNICRARIPVLLMAGRAPYTTRGELLGTRDTYVHFIQEPFDQAALVRPYTKWEYNLPSGVVAKEALRRAHTVMMSDPKGPVYMTFPRETLTELWSEGQIRSYPEERFRAAAAGAVDRQSVDAIATRLLAAERPLLITAYSGRNARRGRAARRAGAVRRHPRRRIQSRSSQPAARFALPWRVRADQGAGRRRCRPAGRCRCAVDPQGHAGESLDLVGACRCRPREAGDPDVDLPGEPAPAGRQLRLLCRPARRAEGQGRCRLQGAGGGAREGDRGRGRWRVASRRPGSPPSPASPARSTRTIFAPSWPRRSVRPAS